MYLVGYLVAQHDGGLVGPAARDVADRVAAAAQHERGQVIREHVPHALRVATHTKVEAAESVTAQAVGPHWSTRAPGWYVSMTFCITGTKIRWYDSSVIPSRSGTLTE